MTIYLYVKTHNKTGLKYLGKTKSNPFTYLGSGKMWKLHLKEYGKDHTTEILKICQTSKQLKIWGRYYSTLWNVIQSKNWANLIPETGGGPGASKGTKNHKGKNNPMFGKKHSEKIRLESKQRRAKTNSERRWYNNGIKTAFLKECPAGWKQGRINQKPTTLGRSWYNNGIENIMSLQSPGKGWIKGMLPKNKKNR